MTDALPPWQRPLVVVAHPDDESFGLGAVLTRFVDGGATASVLCFTHGEASTLHGVEGDLRRIRAGELQAAASILGLGEVELLDHPDGGLADRGDPPRTDDPLADKVVATARRLGSDGLLVFGPGGVTGHPDHVAATDAAVRAARRLGLPVLGWVLPLAVAEALNAELGTAVFVGTTSVEIDLVIEVDRARQLQAVQAHPSQAVPSSVLWRRLELSGDREQLRWLVAGNTGPRTDVPGGDAIP
jgi:N-acetylglucosamine malate deacetylase 2